LLPVSSMRPASFPTGNCAHINRSRFSVFPLCVALISAGDRFYRSAGGEAFTAASVR
jgi:hypothetical protein